MRGREIRRDHDHTSMPERKGAGARLARAAISEAISSTSVAGSDSCAPPAR